MFFPVFYLNCLTPEVYTGLAIPWGDLDDEIDCGSRAINDPKPIQRVWSLDCRTLAD